MSAAEPAEANREYFWPARRQTSWRRFVIRLLKSLAS